MSLAFLLFLLSPTHVGTCEDYDLTGDALVCFDNGVTYPEGNYALHHDSDDGEIMQVEVWR